MPTTAKILKGGGHQVTNTVGTNERFAERAVCREGGVRSWKRWPPWKTHWGKRAGFTIFRSNSLPLTATSIGQVVPVLHPRCAAHEHPPRSIWGTCKITLLKTQT